MLNVGMPGVGLGGIFYLVAALAMPLVEGVRALRGRPRRRRWGLAFRQAALALGVLGATWVTGLAIGRWRPATVSADVGGAATPASVARQSPVRAGTLAFGVGLLALVVGSVEVLRFAVGRAPARTVERTPSRRLEDAA